jgi:hypothetical protein
MSAGLVGAGPTFIRPSVFSMLERESAAMSC